MAELTEIREAARAVAARGEPLWLATVMRVEGSAYRHPGARLLFTNGRALAGSVSGGCFEASIVRKGPWLTREHPACITFEGGREADDETSPQGTGCDGTVDILVERVLTGAPTDPLALIDDCSSNERRGVLVTIFDSNVDALPIGSRLVASEGNAPASSFASSGVAVELEAVATAALAESKPRSRVVHGRGFDALLEIIEPAPHLFVIGSGPDALPVAEIAHALGLGVTVCDTTGRVSARERFAGFDVHVGDVSSILPKIDERRTSLAVVMAHHYPTDMKALEMLLASRAAYIGMLGPARRTSRMVTELSFGNPGIGAQDRARIRAPIGLDLGAETPSQIALSIVAEIQAVLARASAEPLSRRGPRPIHVADAELTLSSAMPWARTGTK